MARRYVLGSFLCSTCVLCLLYCQLQLRLFREHIA
jgi:hypothetical protein